MFPMKLLVYIYAKCLFIARLCASNDGKQHGCVCVCVCVCEVASIKSDSLQLHDCSLPGSSVHGDSADENTGVDCHSLLQGIFPTQGSNPCLLWLLHAGKFFTTDPPETTNTDLS